MVTLVNGKVCWVVTLPLLAPSSAGAFVAACAVGSSLELIPHLFGANRRPTGQRGAWLWARYGADSINDAAFRMLVA